MAWKDFLQALVPGIGDFASKIEEMRKNFSEKPILQRIPEMLKETGERAKSTNELMQRATSKNATDEDKSALLNFVIGMSPAGVGGTISPGTWRAAPLETKSAITMAANKNPSLMESVLRNPRELVPMNIEESARGGAYGLMQPDAAINKATGAKGDVLGLAPDLIHEGPHMPGDVATHEITHYDIQPKVTKTSPEDAGTMGLLLNSVLQSKGISPDSLGSLGNRIEDMSRLGQIGKPFGSYKSAETGVTPMDRIKHYLDSTREARSYDRSVPNSYGQGSVPRSTNINRLAMDEGLAYLAENAHKDPDLMKLAKGLGLNVGDKEAPLTITGIAKPSEKLPPGGLMTSKTENRSFADAIEQLMRQRQTPQGVKANPLMQQVLDEQVYGM